MKTIKLLEILYRKDPYNKNSFMVFYKGSIKFSAETFDECIEYIKRYEYHIRVGMTG